jgi:hypothetical protein
VCWGNLLNGMIDRKDIVLALQITRSSFIEVAFHEAERL